MTSDTDHHYLGETLLIKSTDGASIHATVAYHDDADLKQVLLVCPPNPILGGDCQNNVVQALLTEAVSRGGIAITFDYRGSNEGKVGDINLMTYWETLNNSDDFSLIIDDTLAVVEKVHHEFGTERIATIAGYSFGSYIALQVAELLGFPPVCCISPPLAEYNFVPWLKRIQPQLFIAPNDPFCPQDTIARLRLTMPLTIHTVPGQDHFFRDSEAILSRSVFNALNTHAKPTSGES